MMRGKELKDFAHNTALDLLDVIVHDYQFNFADIRFFSEALRKEMNQIKNYVLIKKARRPKKRRPPSGFQRLNDAKRRK